MAEFCPRPDCGKKLEYDGESLVCRHCGFHDCLPARKPMTRAEVKDTVRRMRALRSGSCLGRRHGQCKVSTCECGCHREAS